MSARLVQLVPNAFVVRMDRALESQTTEYTTAPLGDALRAVPVRVWAELGRARMPAGTSLDLPTGSVVELDREVEDPVDLYVDGLHFATGRLRVAEDGSLQLEVEAGPRARWRRHRGGRARTATLGRGRSRGRAGARGRARCGRRDPTS